ncbi:hypothetical protein K439DRAFT_745484 [Ramaria rubella]|nr:hypothetical protein K439DRAFT_745484 [Ramaria rubella]
MELGIYLKDTGRVQLGQVNFLAVLLLAGLCLIWYWTHREISYHNVTSILIPSIHPGNFPALKSVSIRMLNVDRPLGVIERLPPSVERLEIWKFDTMIHDDLFNAIASRLPDLRELRLHGMGEVDKFGVGTLFESADSLGVSHWSSAVTNLLN